MGATTFRRKTEKADIEGIEIKHYRIEDVPEDADIVVVHKDLQNRAQRSHPDKRIVAISNYLQDPVLDDLIEEIKENK